MAGKPNIRRISSLKSPGVFANYKASSSTPAFQRQNLIYGFNGSGKTTLSRVFASVAAGEVRRELGEEAEFSVELTDSASLKSEGPLDTIKDRVLVFNVDFIRENLRWSEGSATPIFYLGKDQADLSKKLEQAEAKLSVLGPQRSEATRERSRCEKAFADYKRDRARLIETEVRIPRGYTAATLAKDYEHELHGSDLTLSEEEQKQQVAIISQADPLPKHKLLENEKLDLVAFVRSTEKLLRRTLGKAALDDLQQHAIMLRWVKEGLDYHMDHNISSCLLCGNSLTPKRIDALDDILDQNFERLAQETKDAIGEAKILRERINALQTALPASGDISRDLVLRVRPESSVLRA